MTHLPSFLVIRGQLGSTWQRWWPCCYTYGLRSSPHASQLTHNGHPGCPCLFWSNEPLPIQARAAWMATATMRSLVSGNTSARSSSTHNDARERPWIQARRIELTYISVGCQEARACGGVLYNSSLVSQHTINM